MMSAEWMVLKWVEYCERKGVVEEGRMEGIKLVLKYPEVMLELGFDRLASVARIAEKSQKIL